MILPAANYLACKQGRGVRGLFYDQGVWIHETDQGYFAYPHPYIRLNLGDFDAFTRTVFFRAYLPEDGDVIVDVGAGAGEETLTFSRAVGDRGRVISVEAHPRTFRCLEKLVQYNRLKNVVPVHRAISQPACRVLRIEDSSRYLGNRTSASSGLAVTATTLDELMEELQVHRINFLKMNIEGAERSAILGMTRTLERTETVCICCHDFLADASHDDKLRTRNAVTQFLQEHGFNLIHQADEGLPPYVRDQVWASNPRLALSTAG